VLCAGCRRDTCFMHSSCSVNVMEKKWLGNKLLGHVCWEQPGQTTSVPHLPGRLLPSPTAALLSVAVCHWRSLCLQGWWVLRPRHLGSDHPAWSQKRARGRCVQVCRLRSTALQPRTRTWLPCCC
jgi:hypothetical protein